MSDDFVAQVSDFVAAEKNRLMDVAKTAAFDLFQQMQTTHWKGGHNRIDKGWHLASFQASLNSEFQDAIREPPPGKTKAPEWQSSAVSLVINGAGPGDVIVGSYGMAYSARLEYGFDGTDSLGRSYHQPGYMFVRLAAQDWPEIVKRAEAKVTGVAG